VARKQIELATCGLRQITEKLWKFFTDIRIPDTGLQVIKSSVGGNKKLPEFQCNLPQTACG
jgi:hypothetical protein